MESGANEWLLKNDAKSIIMLVQLFCDTAAATDACAKLAVRKINIHADKEYRPILGLYIYFSDGKNTNLHMSMRLAA